ncbi:MAG: response regulator transcription factor [Fimbriimonadales bacterium]
MSLPQRTTDTPLILVVEDEPNVASFVEQSLREAGYRVLVAGDAASAEGLWASDLPDLVVLDLMLPDRDGVELLRSARKHHRMTPVLVLSAKSSMSDRVSGLDAGADDYLGKPFGIEELLARVRVLLRRSQAATFRCDDLLIDFSARRVTRADRLVFLSETEYRLLEFLAQHHGEPVSKRDVLAHVWDDADGNDNVVEVYVSYLRGKLEWRGAKRLLHTVRGRGYVLSETYDAS